MPMAMAKTQVTMQATIVMTPMPLYISAPQTIGMMASILIARVTPTMTKMVMDRTRVIMAAPTVMTLIPVSTSEHWKFGTMVLIKIATV